MIICRRSFNSRNVINITGKIEQSSENGYTSFKEVIFIEVIEYGMSGKDAPNVPFNAWELRQLVYAIKTLVSTGKSSFTKGSGQHGKEQSISLSKGDKGYFINGRRGDKRIGFQASNYEILALADSLQLICEEVEKALYSMQRG